MAGKRPTKKSYPGSIRIIAGQWRGRRLPVPESEGLRPTPNRVRETVFNWLRPWLPGARCLDVTAGTGSLCFEALSQGADRAVLVESARVAVQALKDNVERLKTDKALVIEKNALAYLKGDPEAFDIVFLDPPFNSDLIQQCSRLLSKGWVKPGGLVYIEAPASMSPLPIPPSWEMMRSKKTGEVGYHLARIPEMTKENR